MSHELTRRSFFSGVIATVAATSLVIEASPAQIQKFSKGIEVEGHSVRSSNFDGDPMLYIKDPEGQFHPFAFVTGLNFEREMYSTTRFKDEYDSYMPGGMKWSGDFVGYGPLTIRTDETGEKFYNNYPLKAAFKMLRESRVRRDF